MANDPGKKDSGPDSRPISVSELLARSRSDDEAPSTASGGREGRGRRRAGRSGTVSVSELTGEIPAITTAPEDTDEQAGGPSATPSGAAEPPSAPEPPSALTGSSTPAAGGPTAFPRSGDPVARRTADTRPQSAPSPFARPTSGYTASGMPGFTPPPTRDFHSGDVADRLDTTPAADQGVDESSNEVTGIIPVVADTAPHADDAADGGRFGEVMDDFDAYRNFADVEVPDEEPKKKRGWFSRRKKADAAPSRASAAKNGTPAPAAPIPVPAAEPVTPAPEQSTPEQSAGTGSATVPDTDVARDDSTSEPAGTAAAEASAAEVSATEAENASEVTSAIPPVTDAPEEPADTEPEPEAPSAVGLLAGTASVGTTVESDDPAFAENVETYTGAAPDAAPDSGFADTTATETTAAVTTPDTATPDTAAPDTTAPDTTAPHTAAAGTAEDTGEDTALMSLADLEDDRPDDAGPAATETAAAAETGAPAKSKAELRAEAKAAEQAAKAEKAEKAGKTERSPAMAWLALIAEVVVGLAVGVGLFWGFTELWRWNVYFALVLAVLVIFGIVTFSHLVRKSNDLITTLLALAVGLIVTIGPLVLLAT